MSDPNNPSTRFFHIILLRHGESIGNAEYFHQGQSDFPLTNTGVTQAQALADRWVAEEVTFDQIICSPLARARQTAEIITQVLYPSIPQAHLPIEFNALWMERDAGMIAALHESEALERYPRPDFVNPYQSFGVTGEGQWQLYLRAGQALQDLITRPPADYLIVSHGGILNMVLFAILGISPQANFQGPRFRFRNTAFASLTYKPADHYWFVEAINDHAHLPHNEEG
jgi:2,3-bisphosphoglycerate-dependent phosphoglycerate mutase